MDNLTAGIWLFLHQEKRARIRLSYPASESHPPPARGAADFTGIGGSFRAESVAGLPWIGWQLCYGIGGRLRPEYARWLAKLLRLGLLPEGYIYPKEERPVRDLLRRRSRLVQQHTGNLQSVQNLLARNRGHSLSANRIKRLTNEEVDRLLPDADLALAIKSNLAVMRTLQGVIGLLEKTVKERIKLRPQFKPLLTVSGIGQILGLTIMLETGEIGRFAKVGNYASYCRCVGSEHLGNGIPKGRGNTKNGNKYLAWAYVEAANFAVRYNPRIKRYYQRKRARTNGIVAIKTVAHKLIRACYYILRDQVSFDVNKAFA